jgi:hypothetical protein
MRLAVPLFCALAVLSCAAAVQAAPKPDLSGDWTFVWDGDPKNANDAVLKQKGAALGGVYLNDAGDECSIAGRVHSSKQITMTVTCPKWAIQCDGALKGRDAVSGAYLAYGDSKGEFAMERVKRAR